VIVALVEGCHIASMVRKSGGAAGINPLWTPPWPAVEPSAYNVERHPEFGTTQEAPILASIMGHSICLDTYGAPSPEEAAAGMPIHGEGPLVRYNVDSPGPREIRLTAILPLAQLRFERTIALGVNGGTAQIHETVDNLSACDRPIAWTQHVTMGPPFIEHGQTRFYLTATRSRVIDADFGGVQLPGAEFNWPLCPTKDGGQVDLRRFTDSRKSGEFSTHLSDPDREHGAFTAWSPAAKLAFGYAWNRNEFPWICRWEENHNRTDVPWSGRTLTCAIEFGVSPVIESRREMVNRGRMFDVPAFRWLPARSRVEASYCAFLFDGGTEPTEVRWNGGSEACIRFER
jgi:hypothetical protein